MVRRLVRARVRLLLAGTERALGSQSVLVRMARRLGWQRLALQHWRWNLGS